MVVDLVLEVYSCVATSACACLALPLRRTRKGKQTLYRTAATVVFKRSMSLALRRAVWWSSSDVSRIRLPWAAFAALVNHRTQVEVYREL